MNGPYPVLLFQDKQTDQITDNFFKGDAGINNKNIQMHEGTGDDCHRHADKPGSNQVDNQC